MTDNSHIEGGRAAIHDAAVYRRVLGHVPTSVAVVTATGRSGRPVGMTVGSFTSVSLDPPLVAFFVDQASSTWPHLYAADHFGVSILGHAQSELCRAFSRRSEDRFVGVDWHTSDLGVPLLSEAIVTLECSRAKIDLIGDHYQVVGRVESMELRASNPPLIFLQGGFVDMDGPSAS
ncbi:MULTISPECIES: flavin reductase family protein [unclassified Streptomyces]|uniref:flavin reductase family protein n=1 Tax=unclassified Streptomyces TaxID=2593676 RepID=UPI0022594396|nr:MULTISPECIES: flavin reductase family protein [unclassified Streptomyces]MCX4642021.1 flavin reductase family protein [Streptomyces sp. NBC_01446]MCX5085753.1 flavin reductase family protein [Streptomyces sp. NBC_00401]MCX5326894.1 flavin reductase family protein [Streptomyces sp. NBC_00120]